MTAFRKIVFRNNCFYHVYNRSIEKKPIFNNLREYSRAILALQFYRFSDLPVKLSKFLVLNKDIQLNLIQKFNNDINKLVDILAYGIMPNHFHFILEQKQNGGISRFISNFENSYTKYYNTKEDRVGPIFQGIFKSVYIESEEQLIHLSRYIHLNPISSSLIKPEELETYPWSSFPEYLNLSKNNICNTQPVMNSFPSINKYRDFVYDQIAYAKELEKIKHLTME